MEIKIMLKEQENDNGTGNTSCSCSVFPIHFDLEKGQENNNETGNTFCNRDIFPFIKKKQTEGLIKISRLMSPLQKGNKILYMIFLPI